MRMQVPWPQEVLAGENEVGRRAEDEGRPPEVIAVLSKEALCRHQSCKEYDVPQGFSTETKLAMLISQPGGILAGGNLTDRLTKSRSVDCFELPSNAPGSSAARCFGKFNRAKRKEAYFKPERLRLELTKCSTLG